VATTVALLDGLTDCTHRELSGRCTNVKLSGGTYTAYSAHGSHTAGTVAGSQVGAASTAIIRNYGVFADNGWVAGGSVLVSIWRDAYDNGGARIASMSFGCSGTALCFTGDQVRAMADPSRPMLFVKAAGNEGLALPNEAIAVSTADASAALARTILVGSVDAGGNISGFSNRAGSGCLVASDSGGNCPTNLQWKNRFIVTPGESIYSTLPGGTYGYMSGTSMAAPAVAGAAALIQERWPALKQDPVTLAQILLTTATDKGAAGVDEVYGWGQLNLTAAMAAQGTVTVQSVGGTSTTLSGGVVTSSSPTLKALAGALSSLTVYDKFGRDFTLGETGAVNFRQDYRSARLMLGRSLLGMGGQRDWASLFFADQPQARSFAMFGSAGNVSIAGLNFDNTMRMGVDLPMKNGGVAQIRLTGATGTRTDFAYDATLRPLSFFASTGMLNDSLLVNTLVPLRDGGRLMVYGSSTTGAVVGYRPQDPLQLRPTADGYMPQLALRGSGREQRKTSFGLGYWKQAGENTVLGLNASMMRQTGGYYDLTSNLADFQKPTKLFNLGAVASHRSGSWELTASGELTHLSMASGDAVLHFTPANLVSAQIGLRKSGVALADGMHDSLGVSLVLPPRAVSGNLRASFLTPTADGIGRQTASYDVPLSRLGSEPPRIEAAYRLESGRNWSFSLTGGAALGRATAQESGEVMASYNLVF
jgi:hypothetical protein